MKRRDCLIPPEVAEGDLPPEVLAGLRLCLRIAERLVSGGTSNGGDLAQAGVESKEPTTEGGEPLACTYAALFRGINVGKAKRVAMADLRDLVAELGYTSPRTVLNSGNLLFSTPEPAPTAATRIEAAVASRLGVRSRITLLSSAELEAIIRENPLGKLADDPSRLQVAVLADPADRARLEPLMVQDWAPEAVALGRRVAYLWCPNGMTAGRIMEAVGRLLKEAVTTRNLSTLTKLLALAANG